MNQTDIWKRTLIITAVPFLLFSFIYLFSNDFIEFFIFFSILFVIFGGMSIHGLLMTNISDAKSIAESNRYYKPGFRPDITSLEMDSDGVIARYFLIGRNGERQNFGSKIEKKNYNDIVSIYKEPFQFPFESGYFLIIETDDKKRAEISLNIHDEKIVIGFLKTNLNTKWQELYIEK